jgi:UDP-glucose 4-epimerase
LNVLVTGGAGYIGSHVVRLLFDRGDYVVVADDLVNGFARRVEGVPLLRIDLAGRDATRQLGEFMAEHQVTAVMHFAARKRVAESVARPIWYYRENLHSLENVLAALSKNKVKKFLFSSSAAVYGTTVGPAIDEDDRLEPINPYGQTKLAGEWLSEAWAAAEDATAVSLRYFNVAGAGWPELADVQALNLVPMVFERLAAGMPPLIFGDDYPTPDGTCIRDYVHVLDVAEAHLVALTSLNDRGPRRAISYNVGTGSGSSVREVLEVIADATGMNFAPMAEPRRPGDPAEVVASVNRIRTDLGWSAKRNLGEMVRSAWAAR